MGIVGPVSLLPQHSAHRAHSAHCTQRTLHICSLYTVQRTTTVCTHICSHSTQRTQHTAHTAHTTYKNAAEQYNSPTMPAFSLPPINIQRAVAYRDQALNYPGPDRPLYAPRKHYSPSATFRRKLVARSTAIPMPQTKYRFQPQPPPLQPRPPMGKCDGAQRSNAGTPRRPTAGAAFRSSRAYASVR